ncbi:MAG: hypothetical protein K5829_02960 [Treponema sp.]|nr:hypothetical protein [Treponema sp.]
MENNENWLGYKVMCHCRPKIVRAHNIRNQKIVAGEKHIDPTRPHKTILDLGTLEEAYHKIFDESVAIYNAQQKRKDRRIENYLETILNDKRQGKHKNLKADGSRKPAYEMIVQVGRRENCPDDETGSKILKEFCEYIPKKYPCIVPIGIYLHGDEFSIDDETGDKVPSPTHIHFDYVYVAHQGKGVKTGMPLQCSLSGALREMGFVTGKGGTAQQKFEEAVRHDLQNFAEERGLKIDRTPGERHQHKEKPVYQQMMDNRKSQERLIMQEAQISQNKKEINEQHLILSNKENDLNRDKQLFDTTKTKIDAYVQIKNEVKKNNLSIDTEVQTLTGDRSKDFPTRLNRFISNVKKIVTSITTELNFYKAAFEKFWHKRSADFRKLADFMDRNHCIDFDDYNRKFHNGLLDYQLQQKRQIQQQHQERKQQIDDEYDLEI